MKVRDDFKWDTYTSDFYERELKELKTQFSHDRIAENFSEVDGELTFEDNLHENWKEIYHQVHDLKVESAFECGCGCAHHLININRTSPDVVLNGCDYAQSQIDLGYKYFELDKYDFHKRLIVKDMTISDGIEELGQHEFVYTQAVTMHLAHAKAKKFLINMGKLSSKYIYLIENIHAHDYDELLKESLPDFEKVDKEGKYLEYGMLLRRK